MPPTVENIENLGRQSMVRISPTFDGTFIVRIFQNSKLIHSFEVDLIDVMLFNMATEMGSG